MSEKQTPTHANDEILLDLNFVPQWAKKEPVANHYQVSESSDRRGSPRRDSRRPPRRDGERPPSRGRRREEPPRRDFQPRAPRVELPVDIKFLPEQKQLASLVRQIHHTKRAYPLMDLAHIFLSNARGHRVKLEVKPDAGNFKLYQGKHSKMVATDREVLLRQILDDHLESFFVKEDIEVEPPTGNFPMVGKVGDILIGPPNHHSYTARLEEVHRAHYAHMPFDRFKQNVQTVRDEELVERWKQEASRKTVYRLQGELEGKEYTLHQAEGYLRTHLAEKEIVEVTRAVLPSSLARRIKDENLIRMVREAWQQESRFPISLGFSLRAAFRHLHLCTFKAGKNINFVTGVKPDPVAPEKTVENIRIVLEALADHPGSTRQQLLHGLRPDASEDSPEAHKILDPIHWLVEKGHIIEFFNGTLSVPSHRRRR